MLSVVCFLVSASVWTVYAVSPTETRLAPRAKSGSLTVTGAGDAFMVQRFPADYQIDPKLRDWIVSADARVVNFEAVVNDGSCPPAAWSGGTWASMHPSVLPDFLSFGFNGCGCANNHSLDYSAEGLHQTRAALAAAKMPFCGIGRDLQEATAAAFIETSNGRVAVISVNCEFHPDAMAGWRTAKSPGRPGLNGLRHTVKYFVTPDQLSQLKEIATKTTLNGQRVLDQQAGFALPDAPGTYAFGGIAFEESSKTGKFSACNARDLKRITDEIRRVSADAAAVLVLAHSHSIRGTRYDEPDRYFEEFCRAAVEAGATAVFGGGTHQLKGIEFYRGKPIFYSLGDFVFQNNVVPTVPPDFCEKYGVALDAPAEKAFAARTKGGKIGLHTDRANFLSVLPRLDLENGNIVRVRLLPIELHFGAAWSVNGLPRLADAEATQVIYEKLRDLSAAYGTKIELGEDGLLTARQ